MKSITFLLLVLLVVRAAVGSNNNNTIDHDNLKNAQSIVDWVRSKGGFLSAKLEIGRVNPSSTSIGVFAREEIDSDEIIMKIPRACFIAVSSEKAEDVETTEEWHRKYCQLAHKLINEMRLGNESKFAPYIQYLKFQEKGQTPATWTKAGKDLLRKLFPPGHDVVDWIDIHYIKTGCIKDDDGAGVHAVSMVVQRGYDDFLVPIWDLVNHHNGLCNTKTNSLRNEVFEVRASENIKQGEEIYHTYDQCVDCGFIDSYWGTPEILRDFGFVESYPQRWVFADKMVYFELHKEQSDSGELIVKWDLEEEDGMAPYGIPDEKGVQFLRAELQRLKEIVKDGDLNEKGVIPNHEWETILQYHAAATIAFACAIEGAKTARESSNDEL